MTRVAQAELLSACDGAPPEGEAAPPAPATPGRGDPDMPPSLPADDVDDGSGPACRDVPRPRQLHDPGPPPGLAPPKGGAQGAAAEASPSPGRPAKITTSLWSQRTPLSSKADLYVPAAAPEAPEVAAWVPIGTRRVGRHAQRPPAGDPSAQAPTTVMMRNLPYGYTRQRLIDLLNSKGFFCKYDFLYLPFDFESQCHIGYAFVNLTTPAHAARFVEVFHGFKKWRLGRGKRTCVVSWGSIQGFRANVERFETNPIMDKSVPEEYKPILFRDGVQISFPFCCRTDYALKELEL